MMYFRMNGLLTDGKWLEENNDSRVMKERARRICMKTEDFNQKLRKKAAYFVADVAEGNLSIGILCRDTPKHGSWLDMAECELAAMTVQALLGKRIPDIDVLNQSISAWETRRNNNQTGISWHFSSEEARIRLRHLYREIKF